MLTTDQIEARAADIVPGLLASELAKLADIPADRLRLALAHRLLARRLPDSLFPDLPRDVSQQPCPDDLGDAVGVLLLARDVFAEPDGVSDSARDIVAALLLNMAVRLRAVMQWHGHCRMEAHDVLHGEHAPA